MTEQRSARYEAEAPPQQYLLSLLSSKCLIVCDSNAKIFRFVFKKVTFLSRLTFPILVVM